MAASNNCKTDAMARPPDMFVGAIIGEAASQNKGRAGTGWLRYFFSSGFALRVPRTISSPSTVWPLTKKIGVEIRLGRFVGEFPVGGKLVELCPVRPENAQRRTSRI